MTWQRRQQVGKSIKVTAELNDLIENGLREKWSPEQISGHLAKEGRRISH